MADVGKAAMLNNIFDSVGGCSNPISARNTTSRNKCASLLGEHVRLDEHVFDLAIVALQQLYVSVERVDRCRDIGQLGIDRYRLDGRATGNLVRLVCGETGGRRVIWRV